MSESPQLNTSLLRLKLLDALRNGDHLKIDNIIQELNSTKTNLQTQDLKQLKGTILHYAVQVSSLQTIQYLVQNLGNFHIDINSQNSQDSQGNTPLHLAAQSSRIDVVKYLLSLPNINDTVLNLDKKQPVEVCKDLNVIQLMQFERAKFVEKSACDLRKYFTEKNYNQLENLLVLNPRSSELLDINGADPKTGNTVLHEFIRKDDYEMCDWILKHGGDPFKRDKRGKLPIDLTNSEKLKHLIKVASKDQTIMDPVTSTNNAIKTGNTPVYKGYLRKWTNFASGYKLRYFVLDQFGILSYYTNQDDSINSCRGSLNLGYATLHLDSSEKLKFEIFGKNGLKWHLKANHPIETNRWIWQLQNAITIAKDNIKKKNKDGTNSDFDEPAIVEKHHHRIRIPRRNKKKSDSATSSELNEISRSGTGFTGIGNSSRFSFDNDQYTTDLDNWEYESESDNDSDETNVNLDSINDAICTQRRSIEVELTSLIELFKSTNLSSEYCETGLVTLNSISELFSSYNSHINTRDTILKKNLDRQFEINKLWEKSIRQLENEIKEREAKLQLFQGQKKQLKKYLKSNGTNTPKDASNLGEEPSESEILHLDEKLDHINEKDQVPVFMPGGLPDELNEILAEDSEDEFFDADEFEAQEPVEDEIVNENAPIEQQEVSENNITASAGITTQLQGIPQQEEVQQPPQQEEVQQPPQQEEVQQPPQQDSSKEIPPQESSPPQQSQVIQDNVPETTKTDGFNEVQRKVNNQLQAEGSFLGYEQPPRNKLLMDEDNRPKVGLWGILKSMVGKDMTRMTLPVSFNEPTSLLQRLAEDIEYNNLLNIAASIDDSTLRLIYVATFAATEYSSTINRIAKPFNPLLGETFEYARPDQNFRLFVEQVSHHPPISACRAESPKWDYYGENAVDSKFYGRSFDFKHLGKMFCVIRPDNGVVDKDGQSQVEELYSWKKVNTSVVGIMLGNPTVDNYGKMVVENHTTGDSIVVDMKQRGWRASSAYQLSGQALDKNGKASWAMGGHWNSKIYAKKITEQHSDRRMSVLDESTKTSNDPFSGNKFLVWQVASRPKVPFNLTQFAITLNDINSNLKQWIAPTDTRLRPDQRNMEEGHYDEAAAEKHRVEVKQRQARKFREENKQPYNPSWFTKKKHPITGDIFWEYNNKYWIERKSKNLSGDIF
ncbi:unnamed protein product [Candida verbasci]|uniref:PH domain-containing protein n=1 Tax=Candida verbasci TaxID=1227364 RepID=A0A9W4TXC1_9ASCO|nr:unnamed protein product [Candida verbasci]